jgi:eukaryotic-like serine/threonine-protein kinase
LGTVASGLFRVPASGGTLSPLTTLDASINERSHRWPQVLPGGRFLYWVQGDKPGIYAASLAKPGQRTRLLTANDNALYAQGSDGKGYLLWIRGGPLVAQEFDPGTLKLSGEPFPVADPVAVMGILGQMNVAASMDGVLLYSASSFSGQFAWFDRTGRPLGVVGEPNEYNGFRVSPDGRRIIASRTSSGANDLWRLDVERGIASRLTSNSALNVYPVWSPDGRTVVFRSGIPTNLYRQESSGAGEQQRIAESSNTQDPTDWSRDGRLILYHEISGDTGQDLWVLPVTPDGKPAPGGKPKLYLRTPFNELWGRFSPEASPRWVAYQSDETGRYEVYIQAFPEPRGKFQISTNGGRYPQWGAGGRELFYVSPDNKLMVASLVVGADSVEPSAPRELFPLPSVDIGWSPYDATADGQRFLVRAMPAQGGQPLDVIVNWPAVLKKGAAVQ